MYWPVKTDALNKARRPYTGENKRRKWEYQCAVCKQYFTNKKIDVEVKGEIKQKPQIEIDHIIPAGSLKSFEDLPGFVQRLLCEVDNLQVLCRGCHLIKTNEDKEKTNE